MYAVSDEVGQPITCDCCGYQQSIPAATPERVARVEEATGEIVLPAPTQAAPTPATEPTETSQDWREVDYEAKLREEVHVPLNEMDSLTSITSSRLKRFGGAMIDGVAIMVAYLTGGLVLMALMGTGLIDFDQANPSTLDVINTICVGYFPVFALILFQWNLIATEGQTIGKKVLRMKIVTTQGNNPGFFRGVFLRNWLRVLLCMIPFFGLLDLLVIFGDARRCIHDYLAGTHVVDV
jgi:uncharacterized RDD family membrane protein YckC